MVAIYVISLSVQIEGCLVKLYLCRIVLHFHFLNVGNTSRIEKNLEKKRKKNAFLLFSITPIAWGNWAVE